MDVLSEQINVRLHGDFAAATFDIYYQLENNVDDGIVPLLFYALHYHDEFSIWVDGQQVEVKDIPYDYASLEGMTFNQFDHYFAGGENPSYHLLDAEYGEYRVHLRDMIFFDAPLTLGKHEIHVQYESFITQDTWGDIRKYSLHYALSPAKHWKSFGSLEVVLDDEACPGLFTCNFGEPDEIDGTLRKWTFDSLPGDELRFDYKPTLNATASVLLSIGPYFLALILLPLSLIPIIYFMRWHRRRKPAQKISLVVVLGSLVLPAIYFFLIVLSMEIIDQVIGQHASGWSAYVIFLFALYPVGVPVAFVFLFFLDYWVKHRVQIQSNKRQSNAPQEVSRAFSGE